MKVRLATREGAEVANVEIPEFVSLPEVVVWGSRAFLFHHNEKRDGDDVENEFREICLYWIRMFESPL
jgi:hypothetical protein